jgi:hypothetical protein
MSSVCPAGVVRPSIIIIPRYTLHTADPFHLQRCAATGSASGTAAATGRRSTRTSGAVPSTARGRTYAMIGNRVLGSGGSRVDGDGVRGTVIDCCGAGPDHMRERTVRCNGVVLHLRGRLRQGAF